MASNPQFTFLAEYRDVFGPLSPHITDLDLKLVIGMFSMMIFSGITLFFLPASYGKFNTSMDFLPILSMKINWKWSFFLTESPCMLGATVVTIYYWQHVDPLYLAFYGFYILHYVHRTIIYPFFRVRSRTPSTLIIAVMSLCFQGINGYLMSKFTLFFPFDPLTDSKIGLLYMGLCTAGLGAFFNILCDHQLITLRKDDTDKNYYIPRGFLFSHVSCPNYLSEIIEWFGIFVAFPSWASAVFVFNCAANLVPRAFSTHKFYQKKYSDKYPSKRKAIIPFLF